jgi:hypothetical protein
MHFKVWRKRVFMFLAKVVERVSEILGSNVRFQTWEAILGAYQPCQHRVSGKGQLFGLKLPCHHFAQHGAMNRENRQLVTD